MEEEKKERLLKELSEAAAKVAYITEELEFSIKLSVNCHDGYVVIKEI